MRSASSFVMPPFSMGKSLGGAAGAPIAGAAAKSSAATSAGRSMRLSIMASSVEGTIGPGVRSTLGAIGARRYRRSGRNPIGARRQPCNGGGAVPAKGRALPVQEHWKSESDAHAPAAQLARVDVVGNEMIAVGELGRSEGVEQQLAHVVLRAARL